MNEKQFPDFSGKCLSIATDDGENSHDLFNPSFEYQGNRLFIVGTIPEGSTESGWTDGCIGAVAWDRVVEYAIFKDLDSFQKGAALSKQYHDDSVGNE